MRVDPKVDYNLLVFPVDQRLKVNKNEFQILFKDKA